MLIDKPEAKPKPEPVPVPEEAVEPKRYRRIGKEEAQKRDCSKVCGNYGIACAICDGSILFVDGPGAGAPYVPEESE